MTNATITYQDIVTLEEAIYALARANDPAAWRLGALSLRLREETGTRYPNIFRCEPDESAGMAEVVELHGWSRCVK